MRTLAFLGLGLALAIIIHVDWHFALPSHHPFSLAWPQHWIFAALGFFTVGAVTARVWPERPEQKAMGLAVMAIVIAQVIVPMVEVAVLERRIGYPSGPDRWSGFLLCMAVGLPALFIAARLFRPRAGGVGSPSAA